MGVASTFCFSYILDIILPVLNSSLDNPIATSSCQHGDSLHSGDGDFELSDVLEDVSYVWQNLL